MKPNTISLLIGTLLVLSGCATNPDGSLKPLTDAQRQHLIALEQFALSTAVAVGTQALVTGTVDQNTIVTTINSGATLLNGAIGSQSSPAEAKAETKSALATVPTLAAYVAGKVGEAVAQGVPPKAAAAAASKGLTRAAKQLKTHP